jgi:hypothetical protein
MPEMRDAAAEPCDLSELRALHGADDGGGGGVRGLSGCRLRREATVSAPLQGYGRLLWLYSQVIDLGYHSAAFQA